MSKGRLSTVGPLSSFAERISGSSTADQIPATKKSAAAWSRSTPQTRKRSSLTATQPSTCASQPDGTYRRGTSATCTLKPSEIAARGDLSGYTRLSDFAGSPSPSSRCVPEARAAFLTDAWRRPAAARQAKRHCRDRHCRAFAGGRLWPCTSSLPRQLTGGPDECVSSERGASASAIDTPALGGIEHSDTSHTPGRPDVIHRPQAGGAHVVHTEGIGA